MTDSDNFENTGSSETGWLALNAPMATGEWAGWQTFVSIDRHEESTGPFYVRRTDAGTYKSGWKVKNANLRHGGAVHGGALMTFADFTLFTIPLHQMEGQDGVTVAFNADFLAPAFENDIVFGRGQVMRAGRSLLFLQGRLETETGPVLSFSGVVKMLRKRGNPKA